MKKTNLLRSGLVCLFLLAGMSLATAQSGGQSANYDQQKQSQLNQQIDLTLEAQKIENECQRQGYLYIPDVLGFKLTGDADADFQEYQKVLKAYIKEYPSEYEKLVNLNQNYGGN